MAHLLSSRIEEIFRFGTIGTATAGVFYGLVAGGSLFSVESVWMTSVAYVAAITFQYFGHTLFTFRADVKSKRQIYRFLVVNFFGWIFSAVTVNWLGPMYGLDAWLGAFIVVITLPVYNYVAFRMWAFKAA
jgi:putative flippase GtrA